MINGSGVTSNTGGRTFIMAAMSYFESADKVLLIGTTDQKNTVVGVLTDTLGPIKKTEKAMNSD